MSDLERFYFDLPEWLGERDNIHRQFIGNFISCLHGEQLKVIVTPVKFPCYGLERPAIKGGITFAFHSYNNDKNVFSIKESPIYGLYSIDKNGYSGWSDICVNFDSYRAEINKISPFVAKEIIKEKRDFFDKTKLSKHAQSDSKITLPGDYIFFPMQINSDSVTDHENINAIDVLDYISDLALKTNRYVIIKRHPLCKSRGISLKLEHLLATNNKVLSVDANIHDLIDGCSAVIACNSGVSIEALISGKPVFCFGKSEWYEASHKIEKLQDLDPIFTQENYSVMSEFQEKIIAYLLSEYWVSFNNIAKIESKIKQCVSLYEPNYGDDFCHDEINDSKYVKNFLDAQREIAIMKRKQKKYKKDYELFSFISRFVLFFPFRILVSVLGRKNGRIKSWNDK